MSGSHDEVADRVCSYRDAIRSAAGDQQVHAAVVSTPASVSAYSSEICVLGRRYWAPELHKYRGWEVLIEIDPEDPYADVWTKGRTQRLCTVALIADTGFGDFDSAREIAKQARELRSSVVRWQIAEILDVIDQRIECRSQRAKAFNAATRHGRVGRVLGFLRQAWLALIEKGELSRDEPAQGIDMDLDRIEAVLKHGEALFLAQTSSPSVSDGAEATAAPIPTHRLSGDAK